MRLNPDVVCTLHRGMTRGLLEVLDLHVELLDFVPNDPDAAGCRIELAAAGGEPQRSERRTTTGRR